jgi:hypothetical protein
MLDFLTEFRRFFPTVPHQYYSFTITPLECIQAKSRTTDTDILLRSFLLTLQNTTTKQGIFSTTPINIVTL